MIGGDIYGIVYENILLKYRFVFYFKVRGIVIYIVFLGNYSVNVSIIVGFFLRFVNYNVVFRCWI